MAEEILSVRGLHVYYGASHALQGVDISLGDGIHAVLGRNGMGKTTLCNAIMGLVPVTSGSIRFTGIDITGLPTNKIASLGIGYTPQGRRLWPSLSVDEHLRLCAVKQSPWSVERIYDTFPRLAERNNNSGAQLSGGEQQMLAIARALLPGPRLLIMDEPTEGLAPIIVEQVIELLRKIGSSGEVSVLLVEQNLRVATSVAEDVSIMVNGRISTILPAAQLSTDRVLQEQLLGVGVHAHDAAAEAQPSTLDAMPLEELPAELSVPRNDYTPPPRWSRNQWEKDSTVAPKPERQSPALGGAVIVAGTFDTKAQELTFLRDRLIGQGLPVKTVDLSTSGKASSADIPPHHVAAFHPRGTVAVMTNDRGTSVAAMAEAFAAWTQKASGIRGMISAGGSGGTALTTPAMRTLPIGLPKLMISTVASGDVSEYVGPSDIMMMYSVTDVEGIHRISARILANGADAIAGAVRFGNSNPFPVSTNKPAVGLTMFGVTTPAIQAIIAKLTDRYECLTFHATGTGGQSMEKLVDSGMLAGALDISTTEICDMMMGGVMAATNDRLGAFIRTKAPYLGSVGALDMVNWRAPETVPEKYRDRLLYEHNPHVTLMRTTAEENERVGGWIAERLNQMAGPMRFLLPLQGVSDLDRVGKPFDDPGARTVLFDTIRKQFQPDSNRKLIEVDCHINDPAFATTAAVQFAEIAG